MRFNPNFIYFFAGSLKIIRTQAINGHKMTNKKFEKTNLYICIE